MDTSTEIEENRTPDWDAGRHAYEHDGLSLREVAEIVGVASPESVRKRVLADGWCREDDVMAVRDRERRERTAAAAQGSKLKWAQRRSDEADAAGETALVARARIVEALEDGDHHMTRAAVGAYMVLIDKAQLLSGGATARQDQVSLDERIDKVLSGRDELASRRRAS